MLVLAPMQGLTGLPFRKAFHRTFGDVFDYAVSPFISLTHGNLTLADKKIADVLPENNIGSMPVIPQVLGSEIQEFVDLANRLYDIGYTEVNWNLGCPMPRVARKLRGSGLLPYPDKVAEVLDALMSKTKIRVSVKVRLGYRSDNEIFDLIPVLNSFPLANVIIHPRVGIELYQGDLHIGRLCEVLPLLNHKVIFNGEITASDDLSEIKHQFPDIHGFMIGRGAIADPLLPMKINRDSVRNDNNLIISFLQNLFDEIAMLRIPEKSKANKLKEYWSMMCVGFAKGFPDIEKPLYCDTPGQVCNAVMEIVCGGGGV
ncbi:MAG: tRNA-dihydrouridine synthase family protein [Bacteroidales bacterium]|nr:tRNA-dihydrouridine synthase family protein [Bacteroidales bacterium]